MPNTVPNLNNPIHHPPQDDFDAQVLALDNLAFDNLAFDDLAGENGRTERKSGFTMHSLLMILMLMFVLLLVTVIGMDYFFDLSSSHGQGKQFFCPSVSGSSQQVAVCIKG